MDIEDFEVDELVHGANARMHASATAIFTMAATLVSCRAMTVSDAVRLAKTEWLSLVADPEIADAAALPPYEQAAGRRALRRFEDRP